MNTQENEIRMIEWRIMRLILMDEQYAFVEGWHWYIIKYDFEKKAFELYKTDSALNKRVMIYKGDLRLISAQMYQGMNVFNQVDIDAVEKLSELPSDINFLPMLGNK